MNEFSIVCRVLGTLFYRQPQDPLLVPLFALIKEGKLQQHWPLEQDELLKRLQQGCDVNQLATDFNAMFVGSECSVSPFRSDYVEGASEAEVRAFLQQRGMPLAEAPADHFGQLLLAASWLEDQSQEDEAQAQIALFDLAVQKVAVLDEDDADNPLAAARRRGESLARVFGGAPGSYGAVAADLALGMTWETRSQLGDAYLDGSGYSFGGGHDGVSAAATFRDRVRSIDALVHPQDDRERDLLDGEEVADFAGGFAAAAASLGATPALLHLDTSRPDQPKARTFDEEIARVVRGRLTNPRWISGMLAHGYRGVAEIAQGIDALYAFAATSDSVPEHLFDLAHGALLRDEAVLDGMIARNPAAVAAILSRFEDALRRRLWVPRRNAVADELALAHTRLVPTERVS
ncbi:cobaltochelatase subunit CobN [Bradyrhizobium sp.]|uniref:cobaltochelatase subunit CobN n=1 Tax=Bradyrhizobium sp. TaxID=376 RepID=UPI003977A784